MKTSETIKEITIALLKSQGLIEAVTKDATNPFFKSKYADLNSVINACKEHLNKNGIVILQPLEGMTVETVLIHETGEWMSSSTPVVCKSENDPQALGSAITYARRYGLQSMLLMSAIDDDANSANKDDPTEKWDKDFPNKKDGRALSTHCVDCNDDILNEKIISFSNSKYGKTLCYTCQKKQT